MAQRVSKVAPDSGGFNVTVETVVGRVDFSAMGDYDTPTAAAMAIIAKDMDPGTYRFPTAYGDTFTVTVGIEQHPDNKGMTDVA